ncbi:hypothetical protein GQ44DRAFT_705257 [Phaeosphaeriaceae sp. PMI808]|nr:hypothetical protein GQ44DRAFT_705257 [Phaeosphaeriaceae sp. PMI808]
MSLTEVSFSCGRKSFTPNSLARDRELIAVFVRMAQMAPVAQTLLMSEEGLDRLKIAEPYRRTAYQDGKNGMSIGHGVNNKHHPEIFKRHGPSVTEGQAHQQLVDVNRQHARDLRKRFGSETWDNLNQGQRDSLLISAYNAGPGRVAKETGDYLRKGDWKGVSEGLRGMAPFGFVGTQRVDLSSRRGADADHFLENSPTVDSAPHPDSSSASVSGAAVTGAAIGTVVGVPASVTTGGATFSLVTGTSLSTGTVNIGIAVSFSNPVTAICCVGGFILFGTVIAAGCALASTRKDEEGKERQ